jgi:hypothetical protein
VTKTDAAHLLNCEDIKGRKFKLVCYPFEGRGVFICELLEAFDVAESLLLCV